MRKVYNILQHEGQLDFYLQQTAKFLPTGQMLADAELHAFIYIVEENEQYSYLAFQEPTWEALRHWIEQQKNPVVLVGDETIELMGFVEEIQSLIFNIEGNSNYGDAFVERVEEMFANVLQQ